MKPPPALIVDKEPNVTALLAIGLNPNRLHVGDTTITAQFSVTGVASVEIKTHLWMTERQIQLLRMAMQRDCADVAIDVVISTDAAPDTEVKLRVKPRKGRK